MIVLHAFGPGLGLPDPSPFVTKAEVLLKMAGLDYRTETGGFRRAPKGKLPYIEDDGALVADSTLIRWHLEAHHGIDFDAGLDGRQRALAWSVEKMLEEHLYWAIVDARWCDRRNFEKGPAMFFRAVPAPLRPLVTAVVRRKVAAGLKAQGMGRHAHGELARLAARDIDAVSALLGEGPWLMGATPCGADATVFAFMAGALCPVFETPLRAAAESKANLVAYVARGMRRWFPENPWPA